MDVNAESRRQSDFSSRSKRNQSRCRPAILVRRCRCERLGGRRLHLTPEKFNFSAAILIYRSLLGASIVPLLYARPTPASSTIRSSRDAMHGSKFSDHSSLRGRHLLPCDAGRIPVLMREWRERELGIILCMIGECLYSLVRKVSERRQVCRSIRVFKC